MNQYKINDKCGIFGIVNNYNISNNLINGLHLLQHRGRESAGITYVKNDEQKFYGDIGLVKNIFKNFNEKINIGIGHVRYSTRKKILINNKINEIQPFIGHSKNNKLGNFSLAHNGNIPNINNLKYKFNIFFDTDNDTLIIIKIIEYLTSIYDNWLDIFIHIIHNIQGVYCFIILTNNGIYAIRDTYGVRPLCIGHKNNGYCISSESIALQDYELIREINPGEIILVNYEKFTSLYQRNKFEFNQFCSFEYIYFMNNNSIHYNNIINNLRYQCGFQLGLQENITDINYNNIVLSIPNTAIPGGKGFAKAVRLNYFDYIKKKENSGRTFILPTDKERTFECDNIFEFNENIRNKNVYIIDDSIVRGNTLKSIVKKLKNIGVNNIHLRIISPPVISECYFGIDIPTKSELIANKNSIENIKNELNVDSLKYFSLDDMKIIFGNNICTSCFDKTYNHHLLDW
jgi:amidophosphoribosyltransferase